ncbi:serine hydrolase [Fragilaria crotonensis]|nr:serine hydrolase [Fragilaria crotonensis]
MSTALHPHNQRDEGEEPPPHSDDQRSYVSIRVLCLHDANSNAKLLHERLRPLDERLYEKHGIEFVYINAPLVVVEEDMEAEDRRRIWWEAMEDHDYVGLDASLLHIQQIWKSMPFCGILAVGQGAAVASLLPMLETGIGFGVFVYGQALLEEDEPMMANWPCLHIVDELRTTDPATQRLVTQLPGQVHVAASLKLTNTEWNVMGKFLVEQKKEMRVSGTGEELVLQTHLHLVEQEASRMMAQVIADNPPKALMAVIQPNAEVSGWSGPKRRPFGAEGGGAPCPPEFLLKREKRSTNPNGPNRQHPKAAKDEDEDGSY